MVKMEGKKLRWNKKGRSMDKMLREEIYDWLKK